MLRLRDAIADGDTILAVIKGSAVNNDGAAKVGYLAPSVDGQASAITEALAVAGVDARAFQWSRRTAPARGGRPDRDRGADRSLPPAHRQAGLLRVGSVKTNIGHLDTAAGVASMIKAMQALRHRELPPTLHYSTPNPACQFEETPFYVNSVLRSGTRRTRAAPA